MRRVAVHFCPADQNAPAYAPSTARSTSASAATITGLCPPSSSWTRQSRAVASSRTDLPTGTDPVNEIARTPGFDTSSAPAVEPEPVSTFSTPAGRPASANASAT
jgi:hypothetical protein